MYLPRARQAPRPLLDVDRREERVQAPFQTSQEVVLLLPDPLAFGFIHRSPSSRQEEARNGNDLAEIIFRRDDRTLAFVAKRLVKIRADREVLDGIDGACESDLNSIAVMVERRPIQVGERAAGGQQLRLHVVTHFDRELRLAQDREASRVCLDRRRVVSETEEGAAHTERARAGITEVELQA